MHSFGIISLFATSCLAQRQSIFMPVNPVSQASNIEIQQVGEFFFRPAVLTGGFMTCFYLKLTVAGSTFSCMLDTGSTDTTLPGSGINNYYGPKLQASQGSAETRSSTYGDGSWWDGFISRQTVQLTSTNISASNCPIIVMTKQSTGTRN
jgi:hypothetical protein